MNQGLNQGAQGKTNCGELTCVGFFSLDWKSSRIISETHCETLSET